jgi:SPP1 family predicted phage head-tail adaptor
MAILITPSGMRSHLIQLDNPTGRVPDPDGGYTYVWTPCNPATMYARIRPANQRDLERVAAGTTVAVATHIVTIPFHPEVTSATRVTFQGRQLQVVAHPTNREEADRELDLVCAELVTTGPHPLSNNGDQTRA